MDEEEDDTILDGLEEFDWFDDYDALGEEAARDEITEDDINK
jgi:hypothetical protein